MLGVTRTHAMLRSNQRGMSILPLVTAPDDNVDDQMVDQNQERPDKADDGRKGNSARRAPGRVALPFVGRSPHFSGVDDLGGIGKILFSSDPIRSSWLSAHRGALKPFWIWRVVKPSAACAGLWQRQAACPPNTACRATRGYSRALDPREDFAVLCANCHPMMHRKDGPKNLADIRALAPVGTIQAFHDNLREQKL